MKPSSPDKPAKAQRFSLVEVYLDEHTGARAILRSARGSTTLAVPIGGVDATMMSLLLHGLPAGERPSWHGLYAATLSISGVKVVRVELDAVAGRMVGAISVSGGVARQGEGEGSSPHQRIAAPVEAALLVALETRAPLYATAHAKAVAERSPGDAEAEPAGHALLATLLASLPDEDFGQIH